MFTIGFIGTGNMGGALARAAAKALPPRELALANRTYGKAEALAEELGCTALDNTRIAAECKYIMLGVKPQGMADLLKELAPVLGKRGDRFILITMAAGLTVSAIRAMAGGSFPVIRIMPNTPCLIGSGVTLCSKSDEVTDAEYAEFHEILRPSGMLLDLNEDLIDAGCAVSGCGPAFFYSFIEAMAAAGVSCGLTPDDATALAAATAVGSARMVLESGDSPAVLREKVCSPGGATIAGVRSLQRDGFDEVVARCVSAAFERTKELGKGVK